VPRNKLFSGPEDRRIKRALCIVAHPDDIEFFCAGSVLLMTRRGVSVDFVVATSGDKGSHDPDMEGARLAALREDEQREAARRLGAARVEFLRRRDAELVDDLSLRGELVGEIRRSRPDVLLTFDPNQPYRSHPDHRVIGRVALDAAWPCARDRLTYPEAGPPHETAEAWCFAGADPDLVVDVSEVLEEKIAARILHRSQTPNPAATRARWRRIAGKERFHQVDLR
jgi:LmbE family N-acetylglucosaminyl deacetylase